MGILTFLSELMLGLSTVTIGNGSETRAEKFYSIIFLLLGIISIL